MACLTGWERGLVRVALQPGEEQGSLKKELCANNHEMDLLIGKEGSLRPSISAMGAVLLQGVDAQQKALQGNLLNRSMDV